jgi:hypothetical protein
MIGSDPERGPRLDVSFETPGLAPDLEWVLQSSQANHSLVAEALLHTFYKPVVQIVQALEPSPPAQEILIRKAFSAALHQRYRFRSGTDVSTWFYSAALQAFPASARRDAWPPMAIALQAFSGLQAGKIANLLETPFQDVFTVLDRLDQQPVETLQQAGWPVEEPLAGELRHDWRSALAGRYPPPDVDDDDLEHLADEIAAQAERQGFFNRRIVTLRELALVGLAIVAIVGLLMAANRWFPAAEDENSPVPSGAITEFVTRIAGPLGAADNSQNGVLSPEVTPTHFRRFRPTPTPVSPAAPLPTLPAQANSFSIQQRLAYAPMLWNTVWGDATLTFHGGPGYLGGDRSQRVQFWVSDNQVRVVSGPIDGQPQQMWIGSAGRFLAHITPYGRDITALTSTDSFKNLGQGELRLLLSPLYSVLGEGGPDSGWEFKLVDTGWVGHNRAIVVDQFDPGGRRVARLWLDSERAFVLRTQQFSASQPDTPFLEMRVNEIAYDVDFSNQTLFWPRSQVWADFAQGPQGERSPANTLTPTAGSTYTETVANSNPLPPGTDPAKLALSFLYPPDFDLYGTDTSVQVFAEDPQKNSYRLGTVLFGNPWILTCTRSTDGKFVAFTSRSLLSGNTSHTTRWFDITDLSSAMRHSIPGLISTELAFSPDRKYLAAYGAGHEGFGIYLIRLEDDQIINYFFPRQLPHGLVWSPDSQYVAWTTETPETGLRLAVVGIQSGTGYYDGEYGTGLVPLPASTLGEWQVPMPAHTGGLESCAAAPGN